MANVIKHDEFSLWQKAEGRRQKFFYWYAVVSALISVLTFMATAIKSKEPNH
jgi:hypothetical protein